MRDLLSTVPATAIVAFIAAVLSAGIALLSVYLTNRGNTGRLILQLSHEQTRRQEELLRDKLEELYVLIENWLNTLSVNYLPYIKVMRGQITYNDALDLTIARGRERTLDYTRLEMLINLYFPSLRSAYQRVTDARDQANSVLADHKRAYNQGHTEALEFVPLLQTTVENVNASGENLKREVIALFQRRMLE